MKKIITILMAFCLLVNIPTVTYAQGITLSADNIATDGLEDFVFNNSSINETIRTFENFEIFGQEVRLYPETTISAQEAIEMYPTGYAYIVSEAEALGISSDMDNTQFQEFAKSFAMFESSDSILTAESHSFAIFMDYYENAAINDEILSAVSARSLSSDKLESIMPMANNSKKTAASGEDISLQDETSVISGSSYDAAAAVNYAFAWWDKTNNSDYPYYAEYYEMDTSRNDYNDLDEGRTGQSDPKRAWSDCTNFVSQCLVAGGVPQVKSGLFLPHQKTNNWYYNDSKPSHTWGGASNFYNHWNNRVGVADSTSLLGLGDVISIDFASDGSPDHTVIIVSSGTTDSTKTLAAHSADRYDTYYSDGTLYDFSIEYLYSHEEWSIYGFVIDLAF